MAITTTRSLLCHWTKVEIEVIQVTSYTYIVMPILSTFPVINWNNMRVSQLQI